MSTPIGIVAATARLDEAERAAKAASRLTATTRERLAIGEVSNADLRRTVRAEQKAADAVETAAAGVRVAKKVADAQDEENRRVMERVEFERKRAAQARFAKATTATAVALRRSISDLGDCDAAFREAELVIGNRSGPSSSNLAAWHLAIASLDKLSEIFQTAVDRQS